MTSVSPDGWHTMGKHAVRFEAPDIVHSRPCGDISFNDSMVLMAFVRSLPKPPRGFFSLVDMSNVGRQDPAIANQPESYEYLRSQRAQVFYNATFHHRVLIGIFTRLSKLLKQSTPANPAIFSTEDEARAWIAAAREKDG